MADVYVAAALPGFHAGQVVDVSAWPVAGLIAELAIGRVRRRVEGTLYAPVPASLWCPSCATPYRSWSEVEQHGRHVHGWQGERLEVAPVPAWREVVYTLTDREVEGIILGTCPLCPERPTDAHIRERHPELRMTDGDTPPGYVEDVSRAA